MNNAARTIDKSLVEQAWLLQSKIEHVIDQSYKRRDQQTPYVSRLNKDRLNQVRERAHSRYKRRLQKLWKQMGCNLTALSY